MIFWNNYAEEKEKDKTVEKGVKEYNALSPDLPEMDIQR